MQAVACGLGSPRGPGLYLITAVSGHPSAFFWASRVVLLETGWVFDLLRSPVGSRLSRWCLLRLQQMQGTKHDCLVSCYLGVGCRLGWSQRSPATLAMTQPYLMVHLAYSVGHCAFHRACECTAKLADVGDKGCCLLWLGQGVVPA